MTDPAAGREAWRQVLRALGTPEAEIEAAAADEELLLLAIDRSLGGSAPQFTEAQLADAVGLEPAYARRLYRALGVPDSDVNAPMFNEEDVRALQTVAALRATGAFDDEVLLQLARVTGSSMARIAEAQVSAVVERMRAGYPLVGPTAGGLVAFPTILDVVWRRMMRASARRHMALRAEEMPTVAVGFADLVGFTALSQQLEDAELASLVDRFESTAYDVVAAGGGRVIKMIGDEVMFAVDDVRRAVEVALALSESYHDDESLSDVRVGLACGPVLEREGDLYGPTVNLASRIVGIAYAGSVVVAGEVHDTLVEDETLLWRSLRTRYLKDIGRVGLWVVRRAVDGFEREGPLERARRRRGAMRDKVVQLIAERSSDVDHDAGAEPDES